LLEIGSSNAAVAGLMAIVVALLGLVCRRPALLHALWLLVLLKLISPPLVWVAPSWPVEQDVSMSNLPPARASEPREESPSVPEAFLELEGVEEGFVEPGELEFEPADGSGQDPPVSAGQPGAAPADSWTWFARFGAVWLTGSLAWFLLAGVRVLRFHRALRLAVPAPESLQRRARELATRLGVPRCPTVYLWRARVAPLLWWVGGRARLILPSALVGELEPGAVDTLLLHELAHFRRRDHWVRALEFFVLGLYWWHPAVWFAQRELRECEEQCCDAWVVSVLPAVARTYATALVATLDFLAGAAPVPSAATGIGPVSDLKRRLTMIVRGATPRALSWPAGLGVGVLGLLLSFVPAWAQPAPREDVRKATEELDRARTVLETQLQRLRAEEAVRAQPDVKALEADLARKQKELDEARARLEKARKQGAETVRGRLQDAQKYYADIVRVARAAAPSQAKAGSGVTIRIEISGLEGKPEELKALVARLEKELPGKERKVIIVPASAANRSGTYYRAVPAAQPAPPAPPALPGAAVKPIIPPAPGAIAVPKPVIELHIERERAKTPPAKSESRAEELEKKLDNLLKELSELRQELKGRPTIERPGARK
jgi:beta-lactamase regulating signal transducer with metallopeptidase domain